ncbi:guanine nucleotide binding protein, alpha subunit [Mycena rebaudengoi]|nr:guanine nucleotide binding protein, alpha subunit [Mycena rebaudengoi]
MEDDRDPFAAAIAPPHDESPEDRERRIAKERAEKLVSDIIDDEISKERQQRKKQAKPVKILLLGQSESGKSTTLKNFQLMCEPEAFRAERASWRAIIHLNVIHSVRILLDAVVRAPNSYEWTSNPRSSTSSNDSHASIRADAELLGLRMRLLPLLQIEDVLARRLADPTAPDEGRGSPTSPRRRAGKEVAINSNVAWKGVFMRPQGEIRESFDTQNAVDWDDPEDPGVAINAKSADIKRLWQHPTLQILLERQGIRIQESPGFFLDSLDEIAATKYIPTDEHILRARLKTLGVSEHHMRLNDPFGGISREFHIFDVGGQRSMRSKWAPYFMDMDAIIFLAPISAFDQTLAEEPSMNRLADSFALWKMISSNKLLEKAILILFLNKVDIMQAKLAAGIRLADYFTSYGRRPNDFDSASRYLKKQFNSLLKQVSPEPRMFYCHLTNVVDNRATSYVLAGIKDTLMRLHLKESHLIL